MFSPPAIAGEDGNNAKNIADIKQIQEDLPQESADNQIEPEEKKKALEAIIADFNKQYKTNHRYNRF